MKRLGLVTLGLLCSVSAQAQTCPAVNFQGATQIVLGQPGQFIGGLQRVVDGSFTLHSYSFTPSSATQIATTPQFQTSALACSGRSAHPLVPPANWSFLGANLLGTVPRNPAILGLPSPGIGVGLCLEVCNLNQNLMQAAVGNASFNIASSPTYTVTQDATAVITADLNNDGLADVIVPDIDIGGLYVYLMQASGVLSAPTTIGVGSGGYAAVAADFNGDGKIDLAVTSGSLGVGGVPGTITILLGNGDGTFRSPITLNTGELPGSIVAADLNGDSKPDLVVSVQGGFAVHFGNGDGTFQAAQTYSTNSYLGVLALGDLNKDGKPDLVAVDEDNGVVQVLLNAGNGTFPTSTGYLAGFPEDISQLFLMDFDWDGNIDIVFGAGHPDALTPGAYSHSATVLFGNGAGGFSGAPAYLTAGNSNSNLGGLALADFNADEKPDAVAGTTSGISLLTGHGDGTFTAQTLPFQQGSSSLATGDFNRDGKMDFLATSPMGTTGISVFLGGGDGTFQQGPAIATASSGLTGAAVGDFNGDSKPDFAVVDSLGGTTATVLVYLGNGDGTFQPPQTFAVGSTPQYLQVAEVNGDGKLDLVVTDYGTPGSPTDVGSVAVLLGNGNGTFQPAVQYTAGTNPWFTLVADVNGDGKPDLVTSTELNSTSYSFGLMVRLNQGTGVFSAAQPIPTESGPVEIGAGDFNGDGKVDLLVGHCCGEVQMGYLLGNGNGSFQPEVLFTAGTGQWNTRVADLNGDGKPDAMITMFGAYAASLVNLGTLTSSTAAITIQTAPAGLQFSVDGGALQTAPATLNLSQGTHTLAVATPQAGGAGTQYVFSSWSDSGAASHSITVGSSAATYTATFQTQYQLTISASPAVAGTVSPATGGYYNSGASVPVAAMPAGGYTFSGWTGSVASPSSASTTVTMSAPETVVANFVSSGSTFTLSPQSINVTALAGSGTVTVTAPNPTAAWTAVSNAAFLTITSGASGTGNGTVGFSVAANSTGGGRSGTLTIAGQTFTVTQSPLTTAGLQFYPLTPCRVADTRNPAGTFGGPVLTAGSTRVFPLPSSACNVPAAALAYSLNVTVAPPAGLEYLTIWPTGQTQPYVSTLNSINGATLANAAIVPAGTNGAVSVYVSDSTHVIIDIDGYFAPPAASGLAFYAVTPCRIADTRNPNGAFGGPSLPAGGTRSFNVPSSSCGIPSTAQAYSLNMTVVPPGPLEYLTVWPAGQIQPYVSTLNALQGQVAANAALVPAGTNGAIDVFVSDPSNVIIDINGYFAPPTLTGLSFYPVTPCRVADTRNPDGNFGGPLLGAGATRTFPIPGSSCGLPTTAQAYSLNMTVVPPAGLYFLTTWPAGLAQPVVSTLNDLQGQIVANAAIVPAGAAGGISVYVSDATNVVIDANGYFGQ